MDQMYAKVTGNVDQSYNLAETVTSQVKQPKMDPNNKFKQLMVSVELKIKKGKQIAKDELKSIQKVNQNNNDIS